MADYAPAVSAIDHEIHEHESAVVLLKRKRNALTSPLVALPVELLRQVLLQLYLASTLDPWMEQTYTPVTDAREYLHHSSHDDRHEKARRYWQLCIGEWPWRTVMLVCEHINHVAFNYWYLWSSLVCVGPGIERSPVFQNRSGDMSNYRGAALVIGPYLNWAEPERFFEGSISTDMFQADEVIELLKVVKHALICQPCLDYGRETIPPLLQPLNHLLSLHIQGSVGYRWTITSEVLPQVNMLNYLALTEHLSIHVESAPELPVLHHLKLREITIQPACVKLLLNNTPQLRTLALDKLHIVNSSSLRIRRHHSQVKVPHLPHLEYIRLLGYESPFRSDHAWESLLAAITPISPPSSFHLYLKEVTTPSSKLSLRVQRILSAQGAHGRFHGKDTSLAILWHLTVDIDDFRPHQAMITIRPTTSALTSRSVCLSNIPITWDNTARLLDQVDTLEFERSCLIGGYVDANALITNSSIQHLIIPIYDARSSESALTNGVVSILTARAARGSPFQHITIKRDEAQSEAAIHNQDLEEHALEQEWVEEKGWVISMSFKRGSDMM